MNPIIERLLQQAESRVLPQVMRAGQGLVEDVAAPIVRSVGSIESQVVRPLSKFGQRILNERGRGNIAPNWGGKQLVQQTAGRITPSIPYGNTPFRGDPIQRFAQEFESAVVPGATQSAASLRPGPSTTSFPLDDALTRLGGQARYLQRQAQTSLEKSVGSVGNIYRNLQDIGPTAINPLATRTPTTLLGKVGKFVNPLNPENLIGYVAEPLINSAVPESMRGTVRAGLYTPGGLPTKLLGASLYDMFLNQSNAGVGLADDTLQAQDPKRWAMQQRLSSLTGSNSGSQPSTTGSATMAALNAPGVQNKFIQDKSPVSHGGSPQDRAYHEEATRVAQQTAQNPLFQKYQVADLTKQYNTASSPAEKQRIGLQIWSQTNPLLAAKLSAGQMGSVESHTAPGMSNAGGSPIGGLPMPTTQFDVTSAVAQPTTMNYQQTFGTAIPGMGMVSTTPQVFNPGAAPQLSDGMIQASYGQQLLSSPDFMKVAKDSPFLRQAYQQQGLK